MIRIRLILERITVMKTELLFKISVKQAVTVGHLDIVYHTCFQIEKNTRNTLLIFWEELKKKAKKKRAPPSSYNTMPYYFPTEQVDIVRKMKSKKRRKKK